MIIEDDALSLQFRKKLEKKTEVSDIGWGEGLHKIVGGGGGGGGRKPLPTMTSFLL